MENFNDLSNSAASSTLPTGFVLSETGTGADTTYSVGNGTSNTADTYSFGPTSGTDRALGSIRSNVLSMIYGAGFVNDTGATITTLDVSYVGEQWRLGATDRADSIEFAYSTNATSLTDTSATFTAVPALHFSSPVTTGTVGMLVGNQTGNQTAKTATISGLNIPDDSTFFFRWTDGNAAGADDGLAVDNLSLTAFASDLTVCASGCNFTSIQAAINAAAPGATISVEDGTYGESVTVNKDNLTINGANSGRVHDASDRGAESVVNAPGSNPAFTVAADGATIDGFTINGSSGDDAISVEGASSDAGISNNIVGASGDNAAISFDSSSGQNTGADVSDNAITSEGTTSAVGVSLSNTDSSSVTGNAVTDVDGSGVLVGGSVNGLTIQNNEITGSSGSAIRVPETLSANSGTQILGNTLVGNDYGIRFDNNTFSDELEIHQNRIVGNTTNGIRGNDTNGEPRVDAENNWWGCNEGPTYNSAPANDCNSIQVIAGSPADVDSNPHLTLAANANPAKIRSAGGTSAITASLKKGDAAIAADFPNTSISFVANSGDATTASTIAPGSADTNGGAAMTTLTSGSMGIVSVTATLDNETVLTSVDVNDTPTAEDNEYSVDEDETLTAADLDGTDEDPNDTNNDGVLFNDTDTENDPLTVADGDDADTDESGEVDPVSGPTNGTLILREDGSFAYEPNADFNGEDEFTYAVTDGTSRSEATVDIIVHPVNEAPDAGDDDVTIAEDGLPSGDPLTYDLSTLVTDEEAEIANANTNTFDYAYVSGLTDGDDPAAIPDPVNGVTTITGDEGEITVEGSTLTYTPEDDFNTGTDSFDITYNATDKGDPHGCTDNDDSTNTDGCAAPLSNEGVLTVTVTPVNDAPSFEFEADDPNQTVAENSESPPNENLERFHIVEGFIDPDSISPGPADESAQNVGFTVENDNNDLFETAPVIDEDGDLAYQLAENANGIATVEVVAVDTGSTTNPDDDNESEAQTFTITVTPVNTAPTANTVTASGFEDPSEPIEI
nr:cadherin-like domain-containing protein [Rubrobacter sp.]